MLIILQIFAFLLHNYFNEETQNNRNESAIC